MDGKFNRGKSVINRAFTFADILVVITIIGISAPCYFTGLEPDYPAQRAVSDEF